MIPTILESLTAASVSLQAAHDAAKQQRRDKLAAAILCTQLALNACFRMLAGKAAA